MSERLRSFKTMWDKCNVPSSDTQRSMSEMILACALFTNRCKNLSSNIFIQVKALSRLTNVNDREEIHVHALYLVLFPFNHVIFFGRFTRGGWIRRCSEWWPEKSGQTGQESQVIVINCSFLIGYQNSWDMKIDLWIYCMSSGLKDLWLLHSSTISFIRN